MRCLDDWFAITEQSDARTALAAIEGHTSSMPMMSATTTTLGDLAAAELYDRLEAKVGVPRATANLQPIDATEAAGTLRDIADLWAQGYGYLQEESFRILRYEADQLEADSDLLGFVTDMADDNQHMIDQVIAAIERGELPSDQRDNLLNPYEIAAVEIEKLRAALTYLASGSQL